MVNVLLVYPKYPDTFWSFKHVLKFVSRKAAFPPLGLLTVAAMLPEEWGKRLIDVNVAELKDENIEWADIVFIGAMIVQKNSAQEIISRCKAKGKKVVAGGPVFTSQHEKFNEVDYFVLNEAEITLPLFLKDWKEGNPKHLYTSDEKPDIAKTPVPLWSLINFKDYASLALQYSRGCPFNCEFCDIVVMNGRIPRTKTPGQMMDELQAVYEAGWRGPLFIVDDNFIGHKANVKQMLLELIKWQKERAYPLRFFTEASTNLADDEELMQMMSEANFFKVFLGIETPCVDSLKECGKMQNASRDLAEAVRVIQNNGMQVMGGFIVGFDNDSESVFDAQINFIQQTGVVTAMVGMLNALPKTRLWHRLKAEGRLLGEATGENTDCTKLGYVPKMGKEKLVEGYKKIISTIYSPKYYYQRIDVFFKNYKPTVKSRITKEDVAAFLRSVWSIGILSNARLRYWKLILKTSLTKPQAVPIAVELAIMGLHFEKVANKVMTS